MLPTESIFFPVIAVFKLGDKEFNQKQLGNKSNPYPEHPLKTHSIHTKLATVHSAVLKLLTRSLHFVRDLKIMLKVGLSQCGENLLLPKPQICDRLGIVRPIPEKRKRHQVLEKPLRCDIPAK
ncbi:hypothetical protein Trydic_g13796 [Trypoxylus dichotomus]